MVFLQILPFGEILETENIDNYILSTFKLFIYQKNDITMNLDNLDFINDDKFKDLLHLFIESGLNKTEYNQINSVLSNEISDRSNLISQNIFKLFTNVKTITIYVAEFGGRNSYIFNFDYFLETIILSSSWTQITIKAWRKKQYKSDDNKEEQLKHEYK